MSTSSRLPQVSGRGVACCKDHCLQNTAAQVMSKRVGLLQRTYLDTSSKEDPRSARSLHFLDFKRDHMMSSHLATLTACDKVKLVDCVARDVSPAHFVQLFRQQSPVWGNEEPVHDATHQNNYF
jgi:hypothetical protein